MAIAPAPAPPVTAPAPAPPVTAPDHSQTPAIPGALRWVTLALTVAAAVTLSPMWVAVVLAAWCAALSRPLWLRLSRLLGHRPRAAAVTLLILLSLLLVPVVLALVSLGSNAYDLVHKLTTSEGGQAALARLVSEKPPQDGALADQLNPAQLLNLLRQHAAKAWSLAQLIAGTAAKWGLGLFLFFVGAYTFLVDGPEFYDWARRRAPLPPGHTDRLAGAFLETGRGLLVGVGLTGLTQGVVATVAYLALRIPSALVLGLLTAIAALIPSIGTALVWVPVAAGLAITGRWGAALILTGIGVLVIGTVDNVLRPVFSRFGRLDLPSYALFLAIFGGLSVFGAAGLLLGPLCLRLCREALDLMHESADRGTVRTWND